MRSKTAIARWAGGGHVVLRAYSNGELRSKPVNVTPKTFNDFILARDLDRLMAAIDSLGPMSHESTVQPVQGGVIEVEAEKDRVWKVAAIREAFENGEFVSMDVDDLVAEAHLDHVGSDGVNKSALRRLREEYDAGANGFLEQLEEFDEADEVSVEPLRDWADLHNSIAVAARVMGFVLNPPETGTEDGFSPGDDPLRAAGFVLERIPSNTGCHDEGEVEYRYALPSGACSQHLHDAGGGGDEEVHLSVRLKSGESSREAAIRYLKEAMWDRMRPQLDDRAPFDGQGAVKIRIDTTAEALWNKVFFPGDHELAVCRNCGNAFLRAKKGRAKIWCRDSCRVKYSAKGGPEAWLPVEGDEERKDGYGPGDVSGPGVGANE